MKWNRKKKARVAKGLWVGRLLLIAVFGVVGSLFYVWLRVQMVNMGYCMREQERRLSTIKKENQVLRMRIAQMKSPKSIEAMIRAKSLDLGLTKNWQMVLLPKGPVAVAFKPGLPKDVAPALMEAMQKAEPPGRVPMH